MPRVVVSENYIEVIREDGDPKFYGVRDASGESRLLHWLKNVLNRDYGFDLIKKRMAQDGHLVDDMQQYLRSRTLGAGEPAIMIWNPHWAIAGIERDWNSGKAVLSLLRQPVMEEDNEPDFI